MEYIEYENKLVQDVITSIEKHGGKDCLSSIILTGSLGRGEPTYLIDSDGGIELKSDVEIALVFPDSVKKENVKSLITVVASEFQEELNLMAISEKRVRNVYNFNFSFKIPKYKTIFTYDLFNGSKTIWGQDYIGNSNVSLDAVDIFEAKRLVANRIGELIYLQNTSSQEQRDYLKKQWKGKLMLAIASAWLICEKQYVSSYHAQYDAIIKAADDVDEMLGCSFIDEYKKVFAFLRESKETYEVPDSQLKAYVQAINTYFIKKDINVPKVNCLSRYVKYFVKYLKSGMKYGLVNFENGILQALVDEYGSNDDAVNLTALTWHNVLY